MGDLRKLTEETIAASQRSRLRDARVHAFFDALPDAVFVVDGQGIIDLINVRAELFTGYLRDELIGKPIEILVPKDLREEHVAHRGAYMMHPETRPMGKLRNLACKCKDGTLAPVLISLGVARYENDRYIVASMRPVSDGA